jgi:hypothetical protein
MQYGTHVDGLWLRVAIGIWLRVVNRAFATATAELNFYFFLAALKSMLLVKWWKQPAER